MKCIGERFKIRFVICLVFSIVTALVGVVLFFVAPDGSTEDPAIVVLIIAAILFIVGLTDLFKRPNKIIFVDYDKEELLIDYRGKVKFPLKTNKTDNFYVISFKDIKSVSASNQPEGGSKYLGAVGYAATVSSVNTLFIKFHINNEEFEGKINNLKDLQVVNKKLQRLFYNNDVVINED